jgi:hypothetical protein
MSLAAEATLAEGLCLHEELELNNLKNLNNQPELEDQQFQKKCRIWNQSKLE